MTNLEKFQLRHQVVKTDYNLRIIIFLWVKEWRRIWIELIVMSSTTLMSAIAPVVMSVIAPIVMPVIAPVVMSPAALSAIAPTVVWLIRLGLILICPIIILLIVRLIIFLIVRLLLVSPATISIAIPWLFHPFRRAWTSFHVDSVLYCAELIQFEEHFSFIFKLM